jgi:anaerobic selenocysteine-containing dehydrogenase
VQSPVSHKRGEAISQDQISWEDALILVSKAFKDHAPEEIAFLLGETHDHLSDLIGELTSAIGAPAPFKFGAHSMFEGRHTLNLASKEIFNEPNRLHFDISNSDMLISFGANFLETWISPVSYTRQYANLRKGQAGIRGYFVHFEPRMSQTAAVADEWIPIIPGTETYAALALGRLIAETKGALPELYLNVNAENFAARAGVDLLKLQEIAEKFVHSKAPLAIPGSWALGQKSGLNNAQSILAINQLAENIGRPGGIFSVADPILADPQNSFNSISEIKNLISKLQSGEIKVLFVHGINPVFEIPKAFGFSNALQNVELIVSFATFPDETALASDYILPDHAGLESWGYNYVMAGTPKATLSGSQPVVVPLYDTRSTADVLLAAAKIAGGEIAEALPFEDEVEYIQTKISPLIIQKSPLIRAGEIKTFSAQFQQFGGWWSEDDQIFPPSTSPDIKITPIEPEYQGEGEFYLVPYISPILGVMGANKPWLQETPDPTTTVMWNTWVEIHPQTAEELGISDDDIVKIISHVGEIEAAVYRYPGIRPDTIAIPFGQGHTAYGRYAEGRGVNPSDLLPMVTNESGDLVFATTKVNIQKTGKHKQLARLESRIGVYGFEEEH